jgi:hypothetical protein
MGEKETPVTNTNGIRIIVASRWPLITVYKPTRLLHSVNLEHFVGLRRIAYVKPSKTYVGCLHRPLLRSVPSNAVPYVDRRESGGSSVPRRSRAVSVGAWGLR